MKRLFAALLMCSPAFAGYGFVRSITVDHAQVGASDSSSFPILVNGTFTYLKTTGNGGNVTSSSGYDVVFATSTSCSSLLNFERVIYTAASGLVEFWVKVPVVSHTVDTVIYECYGNAAVTTDQSNKAATWASQYKGVYHFQDAIVANNYTLTDSTGNSNGAPNNTGSAFTTTTTGQINQAFAEGGVGAGYSINMGLMPNIFNGSNTIFAWSGWLNLATNSGNVYYPFGTVSNGSNQIMRSLFGITSNPSSWVEFGSTSFTNSVKASANPTVSLSTWYYVVQTFDLGAHTGAIYVNGSLVTTTYTPAGTPPTVLAALGTVMQLFGWQGNTGWVGSMDEVHFAISTPSADWVTAEYNNQKTSSTLLTISSPLALATNAMPVVAWLEGKLGQLMRVPLMALGLNP